MFFFQRNSSPLFSITRSSSFAVIHLSVNIKINVEKETTLLFFFLSLKIRAAVRFSSVVFGLRYLLIKLFYIGVPVVQADGRSGGRTRLVIIVCCKAMYSP